MCDDALNNGIINRGNNKPSARVAGALGQNKGWNKHENKPTVHVTINDSGSLDYVTLDSYSFAITDFTTKTYLVYMI